METDNIVFLRRIERHQERQRKRRAREAAREIAPPDMRLGDFLGEYRERAES